MADENPSGTESSLPRPASAFLVGLKEHRIYRVALGYAVGAWIILQVAAIVLPGFAAPPWVLRALMILLALGFGAALLAGWAYDRRMAGKPLLPRGTRALGFVLLALVPAAATAVFFLSQSTLTIVTAGPAAPAPRAAAPAEPATAEKSIAVLPFENRSDDKANAYFTDGVQDEILTDLSRVADLKVISRTSVMQYKNGTTRNLREIGRQLGVSHLLEGSVQRAGNTVRVTAQLIDARTDAQQWAEHYDRPLDDVFAIQSDIAEAIAGQLQARLSPQEKHDIGVPPTADLQAYDLYLQARDRFAAATDSTRGVEVLLDGVRLLDQALARDPKFLLAWCLLENTHSFLYWGASEHTPARLAQADNALQAALRLQPDAGETHLAAADYYYHAFRDYDRARRELDLARRTLPNSADVYAFIGYIDRRQGRWTESTLNQERALELDPRNLDTLWQLNINYQYLHRWEGSTRVLEHILAITPGSTFNRIELASVEIRQHANLAPYRAALASVLKEDPSYFPDIDYAFCERTAAAAAQFLEKCPREGYNGDGIHLPRAFCEGVVARWEGNAAQAQAAFTVARAEVVKILAEQPDFAMDIGLLGLIDAGLGHKQEAIAEGRRACELLPPSKDAMRGPDLAGNLAMIYAWTGDKAAAVEQLAAVERAPNMLGYGVLKLDLRWDDLRGDPRFEALVASLASKP